jgi:hypothetical protein
MKININGVTREMTVEEIALLEEVMKQSPEQESTEERLAVLEEALEMILSGVTE